MNEGTLAEIDDGEETFHFTIAEYRKALAKVGLHLVTERQLNVLNVVASMRPDALKIVRDGSRDGAKLYEAEVGRRNV